MAKLINELVAELKAIRNALEQRSPVACAADEVQKYAIALLEAHLQDEKDELERIRCRLGSYAVQIIERAESMYGRRNYRHRSWNETEAEYCGRLVTEAIRVSSTVERLRKVQVHDDLLMFKGVGRKKIDEAKDRHEHSRD